MSIPSTSHSAWNTQTTTYKSINTEENQDEGCQLSTLNSLNSLDLPDMAPHRSYIENWRTAPSILPKHKSTTPLQRNQTLSQEND
ncbi:hypothetical protein TNCV_3173541, partial [Trichonephila clavipes]